LGQLKGDKSKFEKVKKVFLDFITKFQDIKKVKQTLLMEGFRESMEDQLSVLEII
jgi:hypothetical protein